MSAYSSCVVRLRLRRRPSAYLQAASLRISLCLQLICRTLVSPRASRDAAPASRRAEGVIVLASPSA